MYGLIIVTTTQLCDRVAACSRYIVAQTSYVDNPNHDTKRYTSCLLIFYHQLQIVTLEKQEPTDFRMPSVQII